MQPVRGNRDILLGIVSEVMCASHTQPVSITRHYRCLLPDRTAQAIRSLVVPRGGVQNGPPLASPHDRVRSQRVAPGTKRT